MGSRTQRSLAQAYKGEGPDLPGPEVASGNEAGMIPGSPGGRGRSDCDRAAINLSIHASCSAEKGVSSRDAVELPLPPLSPSDDMSNTKR